MKTLIIILIIASFIQTTILPVNLVMLILICRAYIKSNQTNLYLAFVFGILTSHLDLSNIGIQSLLNLSFVEVTEILSKLRLAGNPFLIVPLAVFFTTFSQFVGLVQNHGSFEFQTVILTSILSVPTLFLVRLWEERFIVREGIKLRV